jgi:uncharacterized repeat protein (TIGR01451 family)
MSHHLTTRPFIARTVRAMVLLFLITCSVSVFAQVITPFTIRYQATQKGGIRYVSNSIVTCSGVGCGAGRTEVPPAGTATDNGFTAAYVDMDGDGSTFSSSSDSLNLPDCSQILFAGLYWGGEMTNAGANYATRNQVRIKADNGTYTNLTADALQDNNVGFDTYQCFKDITTFVKAAGIRARFTLANVAARVGGTNRFGGWTIVVVYKNDLQPMRSLTVFNGLSNVSGANPITDVTISGFLTPLSGPVTFEVGNVTYDGDRSSTGDQLMFNGGSGFVNISDAVNPLNDIFNSTYSYNGVQKVAPFINPGYTNSLGFDADIFVPNNAAKNYIGNSATSATLRLTTGGETFLTQVVTMAIDVYEPDIRATVAVSDLNGGSVQPGDILQYTVTAKNIGSDPSVNTFITDTLERNLTYVPGSLQVLSGPNAGAKTDAAGDDQGEYIAAQRVIRVRIGTGANAVSGGQVNNSALGTDSTRVRFQAIASTDCVVLLCDNIADNNAYMFGTGNVSGNSWTSQSTLPGVDGLGCPVPGAAAVTIVNSGCSPIVASSNTPVCMGGALNFSAPISSFATYSWTGPNSFVSTSSNPSITNVSTVHAGTYNLTVTTTGGTVCNFPSSAAVTISVPSGLAGTAGGGASTQVHNASLNNGYYNTNCALISRTQPTGGTPASGNVSSKVWIETSTPSYANRPYVRRHYEIAPASGTTGTVTLYFTQADFTAYNAVAGALPKLPTGPGDATGIANLRVGRYAGTSSNNSGLPNTYSGGQPLIDPVDANIVWNATDGRWEVTFTTTGFGGFIVHTNSFTLPVSWMSFTAVKQNETVVLKWQTSSEVNSQYYVVEHSADGTNFTAIGNVAAAGISTNVLSYSFVHQQPRRGNNFYRIRQVDIDGRSSMTDIRKIEFINRNNGFNILVNPVAGGKLQVQFYENADASIYSANGQAVWQQSITAGSHVIDVSKMAKGVYWLKAGSEAKKFIIQ